MIGPMVSSVVALSHRNYHKQMQKNAGPLFNDFILKLKIVVKSNLPGHVNVSLS